MGAAALRAELLQVAERAEQLEVGFADASEAFRDAAAEHFASGGAGQWPPWAQSTAARRSGSLLVDDGDLVGSLTEQGHRGHIFRMSGSTMTIGTRWPVANIHKSSSGRKLPQRDPMPPSDVLRERWLTAMGAYLLGGTSNTARIGI